MSGYYPGNANYTLYPIRSAAILTGSYVAGTIIGPSEASQEIFQHSQLEILVQFTIGSLTTAEIKVEFSNDGTTYYRETYDSIGTPSGGSVTLTENMIERALGASGNYRMAIPILDRYIKISVKGTGTVTSSSMTINAIVGNN